MCSGVASNFNVICKLVQENEKCLSRFLKFAKKDFVKLEGGELQYNCTITEQQCPSVVILGLYTCQLFLRYKREIFILGVLGFFKTTRSFPKISEEVRSLPKTS